MISDKVKLVYTSFGNGIAVGAYGPNEDIAQALNLIYNFKACHDEPRFLSETFGYVLTTREELLKGLSDAFVTLDGVKRANETRESRKGIWEESKRKAEALVDSIECEPFLRPNDNEKEFQAPYFQDSI